MRTPVYFLSHGGVRIARPMIWLCMLEIPD
jgi:hypothetical protein